MTVSPDSSECPPCILIVDDDRTILEVLTKILEKHGYQIDTAESGHEALEKFTNELYTAAVIDVKLGDMNGLDLLEIVQPATPKMLKIVLTGHPSEEDQAIALGRGAAFYLVKPIRAEQLIRIIDGKLGRVVQEIQ